MKNKFINRKKLASTAVFFGLIFALQQIQIADAAGQTRKKPAARSSKSRIKPATKTVKNINDGKAATLKVTQIDAVALRNLLKRDAANAKPLLINFWATWCDPCREEFPDLVKIDREYEGKIEFITVSLDDLAEINRDVPKFLLAMRAEMPAYLLKTTDEEAAIAAVSKQWKGGLPFTILINNMGEIVYSRQGKVELEKLRGEIEKFINTVDAKVSTEPKTN